MTVKQTQRQDIQSFEELNTFNTLVVEHEKTIYGICCHLLSPEEAEEAARQAIVEIYRQRNHFQNVSSVQKWIQLMTVHSCRKWKKMDHRMTKQ